MTLNLEVIKARAEAATEGPWQWDEPTDDSFPQSEENLWTVNPGADGYPDCVVGSWGYDADGIDASPEDRAFIAHARTDIPALIAEVERLRDIVDRVRELHPYEVIELHESHGEEAWCPECQFHYPCQTIRALEGE